MAGDGIEGDWGGGLVPAQTQLHGLGMRPCGLSVGDPLEDTEVPAGPRFLQVAQAWQGGGGVLGVDGVTW